MRFWIIAALCLSFVALVWHASIFLPFTIDDAYITFTYAKRFLAGDGLVFSPGDRVEATSSLLWALLLIPFEWALTDGAVFGSKVLGLLSIVGTAILGSLLIRDILGRSSWLSLPSLAFILALAATSPFIVWSTYGMENGLAALLLIAAIFLFLKERREQCGVWSVLPVFLLEMVRPEGFIFIAIFFAFRIYELLTMQTRTTCKRCGYWLASLTCLLAMYETFGVLYYGHLLPNTVAAKVAFLSPERLARGWDYVQHGPSLLYLYMLATLAPLVALVIFIRRSTDRGNAFPLLLILGCLTAQLLFAVVVGGDWMVNSRFFSHLFPALLVLTLATAHELLPRCTLTSSNPYVQVSIGSCTLLLVGLYAFQNHPYARGAYGWQQHLQQAEERAVRGMAEKLNSLVPDGQASVACSDIGRIGYYFKGRIIDWFGLANEQVAQSGEGFGSVRPETVFSQNPDFIVLYSNTPTLEASSMERGEAVFSQRFFSHSDFVGRYEAVVAINFWHERWHILFRKKR